MATPGDYQPAPPVMEAPAAPIVVVGPQFCVPHVVDLIITKKIMTLSDNRFGVTDVNGNLMFNIKGKFFSLRERRVLLDATGNPVISLQEKIRSAHDRWLAFRGDSSNPEDLLFSVKRSSIFQLKTKLDVFLVSNTEQDVCDFRIEGSWFENSCTIYAGTSSAVVAQMHKKHTVKSILLDKDTFCVTCYPQVDNAFIVALIVILMVLNESNDDDKKSGGGVGGLEELEELESVFES